MRVLALAVFAWVLGALLSGCVCCQVECCEVVVVTRTQPEASLPDGPYAKNAKQSAWDYLAAKYDADGDGAISAAEYDRGAEAFARLDKDESGAITKDDLGPGPVHGLMVRMILLHWFQDDKQPMLLAREEFERGFDAVDADGNAVLTSAELKKHMASHDAHVPMLPKPPPGMDPFLSLALLADTDGDGSLSKDEAFALFDQHAKEETWALMGRRRGAKRPGGASAPNMGAAVGSVAPDFTLKSPDGTRTVTLSDFKGKRPVALIFGSYT